MTSTPPRAARSVAIETTSGIARPRACGQAITSTVMVRTTASSGLPSRVHVIAVITAAPSANQNSQPAARSARRWAREVDACAWATRRWMPASAVSSPTAETRTRMAVSVATVPATTWSPGPRLTVVDSPVIMDSSMAAVPSTTSPSAGTRPPGRTITTSPTRRSDGATVSVAEVPSAASVTRSASSGSSAASASSADDVAWIDRISIQWPSSMITIRRAISHQKSRSWSSRPRLAPRDAKYATVIASPISSIMPGLRAFSSDQAPVRNGRPPQKYMTVPSTGEIHGTRALSGSG